MRAKCKTCGKVFEAGDDYEMIIPDGLDPISYVVTGKEKMKKIPLYEECEKCEEGE